MTEEGVTDYGADFHLTAVSKFVSKVDQGKHAYVDSNLKEVRMIYTNPVIPGFDLPDVESRTLMYLDLKIDGTDAMVDDLAVYDNDYVVLSLD